MFPQSGSGSVNVGPLYPSESQPTPSHLCPNHEADVKYQLCAELNEYGECYCEVSLAGREQIDLVWVTSDDGSENRIIGIEIKTPSEFGRATRELESQIAKYHERTVRDLDDVSYVAADRITPADEVYLFDQVWVVAVGGRDRWTIPWSEETPEDGWLKYDRATGHIEYEIDELSERDTIRLDYDQRVGEGHLVAQLWKRYWSAETLVSAESWISEPSDRRLKDGRIKYLAGKGQSGKKKDADLSIAKKQDVMPVTSDSTIRGFEVKTSFNATVRNQLQEQLPVYCNSKMYSHVYLVVPDKVSREAREFLESEYSDVGLLAVTQQGDIEVSHQRRGTNLELQKIPVGRCPGGSQKFEL